MGDEKKELLGSLMGAVIARKSLENEVEQLYDQGIRNLDLAHAEQAFSIAEQNKWHDLQDLLRELMFSSTIAHVRTRKQQAAARKREEANLRDYLSSDAALSQLEAGLKFITAEHPVKSGQLDILAHNDKGKVIIELKTDYDTPDALINQLNGYMNELGDHQCVVVVPHLHPKVYFSLKDKVDSGRLRFYETRKKKGNYQFKHIVENEIPQWQAPAAAPINGKQPKKMRFRIAKTICDSKKLKTVESKKEIAVEPVRIPNPILDAVNNAPKQIGFNGLYSEMSYPDLVIRALSTCDDVLPGFYAPAVMDEHHQKIWQRIDALACRSQPKEAATDQFTARIEKRHHSQPWLEDANLRDVTLARFTKSILQDYESTKETVHTLASKLPFANEQSLVDSIQKRFTKTYGTIKELGLEHLSRDADGLMELAAHTMKHLTNYMFATQNPDLRSSGDARHVAENMESAAYTFHAAAELWKEDVNHSTTQWTTLRELALKYNDPRFIALTEFYLSTIADINDAIDVANKSFTLTQERYCALNDLNAGWASVFTAFRSPTTLHFASKLKKDGGFDATDHVNAVLAKIFPVLDDLSEIAGVMHDEDSWYRAIVDSIRPIWITKEGQSLTEEATDAPKQLTFTKRYSDMSDLELAFTVMSHSTERKNVLEKLSTITPTEAEYKSLDLDKQTQAMWLAAQEYIAACSAKEVLGIITPKGIRNPEESDKRELQVKRALVKLLGPLNAEHSFELFGDHNGFAQICDEYRDVCYRTTLHAGPFHKRTDEALRKFNESIKQMKDCEPRWNGAVVRAQHLMKSLERLADTDTDARVVLNHHQSTIREVSALIDFTIKSLTLSRDRATALADISIDLAGMQLKYNPMHMLASSQLKVFGAHTNYERPGVTLAEFMTAQDHIYSTITDFVGRNVVADNEKPQDILMSTKHQTVTLPAQPGQATLDNPIPLDSADFTSEMRMRMDYFVDDLKQLNGKISPAQISESLKESHLVRNMKRRDMKLNDLQFFTLMDDIYLKARAGETITPQLIDTLYTQARNH